MTSPWADNKYFTVMSLAEVLATRMKVSDKIDGKALVTAIQRTKWYYSIIYMAFALQRSI